MNPTPTDSAQDVLKIQDTSKFYWKLLPIGVFCIIMLGGSFALRSAFGSVPVALRYLRGERLILEPSEIRIDRPKNGGSVTVEALVSNMSDRPVNLMGANASCSCVVTSRLPAIVEPGGQFKLPITVNVTPDKIVDETIVLFTDHPNHVRLSVRVMAALPASPR
jgi:hypothetical protein